MSELGQSQDTKNTGDFIVGGVFDDCDVHIHQAFDSVFPQIREILAHEITHSTSSWHLEPLSDEDWDRWTFEHTGIPGHYCQLRRGSLWVAMKEDHVLGFAGWGPFRTPAGYNTTAEISVFVREDSRGRGLGKALLDGVISHVERFSQLEPNERWMIHPHVLVAAISADNEASLSLHLSRGFVEVGRMPQVGRKFGTWLDLVLLQRILNDQSGNDHYARTGRLVS